MDTATACPLRQAPALTGTANGTASLASRDLAASGTRYRATTTRPIVSVVIVFFALLVLVDLAAARATLVDGHDHCSCQ
jgi:hypothetical protein